MRSRLALAAIAVIAGSVSAQSTSSATAPKIAVRTWDAEGAPNAALTRGLVLELTHRLEMSPHLIVRAAASGAKPEDVDYVLRLSAADVGSRVRLQWELQRASSGTRLRGNNTRLEPNALAEQPGLIAGTVLGTLGQPNLSPTWRGAHASIADRSAYREFVQILGQSGGEDEQATLQGRIAALEKLLPRLDAYPPAVASLGSDYVDLAGMVTGPATYYDRAAAALERAFALDATYPPARAKLASLYAKIGNSERAVELLSEGLTQNSNYAPYHETLGYVLRYAGLMEQSIDSYRQGQKLDASLDNLVSTQDQITKSFIYLGDYDGALESHRRMRSVLERANRSPDEKQWFYEGVIHLYRGDTTSAVAAFRAGARAVPNSVWTTFGRGYAAIAQGDMARAGAILEELERQEIIDGERHYRLVHFAVFAGRTERALHHLQVSADGGFFNAPYIAQDPWLAPLRQLPRFAQILSAARTRQEAVRRRLAEGARRKPPAGQS